MYIGSRKCTLMYHATEITYMVTMRMSPLYLTTHFHSLLEHLSFKAVSDNLYYISVFTPRQRGVLS